MDPNRWLLLSSCGNDLSGSNLQPSCAVGRGQGAETAFSLSESRSGAVAQEVLEPWVSSQWYGAGPEGQAQSLWPNPPSKDQIMKEPGVFLGRPFWREENGADARNKEQRGRREGEGEESRLS